MGRTQKYYILPLIGESSLEYFFGDLLVGVGGGSYLTKVWLEEIVQIYNNCIVNQLVETFAGEAVI